jgi:uncharacterized protein YkwD
VVALGLVVIGVFAILKLTSPAPTPLPSTPIPTTAVTPTPSSTTPSEPPEPTSAVALSPNIPALQRLMHTLINEDRQAQGLQSVDWDETAAVAALQHAQEMASFGYISHWNLDGYGPDYRYSQVGGTHAVFENVYEYEHGLGNAPTTVGEWETLIQEAHQTLMDSPGHRNNILSPEHTHVAIGIDYSASNGRLAIVQEFVNQYVTLTPLPLNASIGQTIDLSGWLGPDASSPILSLAYEPFPAPRSLDDLEPETYVSPAEVFETPPVAVSDEGQLSATVTMDNNSQPGLYHIWIWVDTTHGSTQAVDLVIKVQ